MFGKTSCGCFSLSPHSRRWSSSLISLLFYFLYWCHFVSPEYKKYLEFLLSLPPVVLYIRSVCQMSAIFEVYWITVDSPSSQHSDQRNRHKTTNNRRPLSGMTLLTSKQQLQLQLQLQQQQQQQSNPATINQSRNSVKFASPVRYSANRELFRDDIGSRCSFWSFSIKIFQCFPSLCLSLMECSLIQWYCGYSQSALQWKWKRQH